jgi:serine/threonine-protein phosphatase PP1 catalytic subunit
MRELEEHDADRGIILFCICESKSNVVYVMNRKFSVSARLSSVIDSTLSPLNLSDNAIVSVTKKCFLTGASIKMRPAADPSVDQIIDRLRELRNEKNISNNFLSKNEHLWLCKEARRVFKDQPVFLELFPPLTIVGDIHGQLPDLLHIFDPPRTPDVTNYLFLGDYVDRGNWSLNTIALLFAYKIKYPGNFFLLRGNHECPETNKEYGFMAECNQAFPGTNLWQKYNDTFAWMPISAVIDGRILCVHGGLSRDLKKLDQLKKIVRPNDGEQDELVSNLLWSDPEKRVENWEVSDRGLGFLFGLRPVERFLKDNQLDILVRAHQAVNDGYEFPYAPRKEAVTVFSAPRYCGEYDNKAALMHVDESLVISFSTIESEAPPRAPSRGDKRRKTG